MKATLISDSDKKWRAESDSRTLREAEEIKRDAKRTAAAKMVAEAQIKELQAVARITAKPTARKVVVRKVTRK